MPSSDTIKAQQAATAAEVAAATAKLYAQSQQELADDAAASATEASGYAQNASDSASLAQQYYAMSIEGVLWFVGDFATAPTTRSNGSALEPGDMYKNTTDNLVYSYNSDGTWSTMNSDATTIQDLYSAGEELLSQGKSVYSDTVAVYDQSQELYQQSTEQYDVSVDLYNYSMSVPDLIVGNENYVPSITLMKLGAIGDGVSDDTDAVNSIFTSQYEEVVVPPGTYIISSTISHVIEKNLKINCMPGAVFKLADNTKEYIFQISGNGSTGDGTNYFIWEGGEIDGNWDGQGDEPYSSNGNFKDVSHGLVVCNFYKAEISNLYIHDCMGHHINHGGNTHFHAHDIIIMSHTATNYPQGGSRGDGITGASRNILIENIYGFTTDDMVAVFSGVSWISGIGTGDARKVDNVTIRNINPWYKNNDQTQSLTTYTWNAVAVSCIAGYTIDKVYIENIKGYTQYSGVRVGAAPGGSDSTNDYYGNINSVIIDGVDIVVAGSSTNQNIYNIIRIGDVYPTSYTNTYPNIIKSITIANVHCYPSGSNRTLIAYFNTTCYNLNISNINVSSSVADDTYNIIWLYGDKQLADAVISDISHNQSSASTDTIANARLCINWEITSTVSRCKLRASGLPVKRNSANTSYISNALFNSNAYQPEVYGYDIVARTSTNFYALPVSKGVHFTDRYLGRVYYGEKSMWELIDFYTLWDSSTLGKPSSTNMTGYSYITFVSGMTVKCYGSPLGEVQGWIYNGSSWQMIGGSISDNNSSVTTSWVPSSVSPLTTIHGSVYNDSTWPSAYGSYEAFSGSPTGRSGAYIKFTTSDGGTLFVKTWSSTNSAWNPWYYVNLTEKTT